MSYDIYGNNLEHGHCEAHPWVHEDYPCSQCFLEMRQKEMDQQREEDYLREMEEDYYKQIDVEIFQLGGYYGA